MLSMGAADAAPRQCVGEGRDEICLISFGDLWGSHGQYAGHTVQISGYLVSGFGQLLLYPGKDYFHYQNASGGIAVQTDRQAFAVARSRMDRMKEGGDWQYESPCPVTVLGTYNDAPTGNFSSLGTITMESLPAATPFPHPCSSGKAPKEPPRGGG
jgi:hypothetical protein